MWTRLIARARDRSCAWMLRIDPDYLGLYRAMDTVAHLPAPVLATLASKASERPGSLADRYPALRPTEPSVATDAPTSGRGLGASTHLTTDDKAGWLAAKFSEEDRRSSVWVRPTIFGLGQDPGVYTGFLDPADLKRIVVKVVEDYEAFPGSGRRDTRVENL